MSLVVVSPYSEQWPNFFRNLRNDLICLFTPTSIAVEHIGSTSVPGLSAKPVIDILLGAASLADIESRINLLSGHGYEYVSKYEKEIPERRYFVKSPANSLRVHIHAVVLGSRLWREHLAFRDALRSDLGLRAQYQSLKLQLAEQFVNNKSAYSAAKNPFVESVLATVSNIEHGV
jgi:GrpB-like predicted nucleotidyltransferase (UPF0157 family)